MTAKAHVKLDLEQVRHLQPISQRKLPLRNGSHLSEMDIQSINKIPCLFRWFVALMGTWNQGLRAAN